MHKRIWSGCLAFAMMTGCYLGAQNDTAPGSAAPDTLGGGGGGNQRIDPSNSGFPCDVAALLSHYCSGCHSSPPSGGAPQSMLTLENLQAASTTDPSKSVGALSVTRMQDGSMPPKPASSPSAAEQAAFAAWVSGGMQAGSCGGFDAGAPVKSPYDTPVQCSSGTHWTGGDQGSSRMQPGGACIDCHTRTGGEGPLFSIAGTVYPTAHEPNDCNGGSGADPATVVITGADGAVLQLPVNRVGNFYFEGGVALPYKAKVVAGGRERAMTASQTSGDCNTCHTEAGTNKAPGRIMAP